MGYHPAAGGTASLPTATSPGGVAWPNINETQFVPFPEGTLGTLAVGDPVYLTDGVLKGTLFVVAIGDPADGVQLVELSYPLQVGALGTTTAVWGFAP